MYELRYVDPTWLSDPHWLTHSRGTEDRRRDPEGLQTRRQPEMSYEDTYFAEEQPEAPAAALADQLVASLPEHVRDAIRLRVFASMSYGDIAAELGWFYGTPPKLDRKRAWRVVATGLRVLRARITTEADFAELIPEGLK